MGVSKDQPQGFAKCASYRTGGGGYEGQKKFVYLKWASHCWLSIQNFIFSLRNFFWFWVGGWFGQITPPPHPPLISKTLTSLLVKP